jgi:hypothetical protein
MIYASVPASQVLAHLDATLGASDDAPTTSRLDVLLHAFDGDVALEIEIEIEIDVDDAGCESQEPVFSLMRLRRAA